MFVIIASPMFVTVIINLEYATPFRTYVDPFIISEETDNPSQLALTEPTFYIRNRIRNIIYHIPAEELAGQPTW